MRNIELKAHLHDSSAALTACQSLGATAGRRIRQVDTYFTVPHGRLKLRRNEPGGCELVYYLRADQSGSKVSDYLVEPVPITLRDLLARALTVAVVVDKVRTLYTWKNVRIHLDSVQELGEFVEFEAVLDTIHDETDGHAKLAHLRKVFSIADEDLIAGSYADLLQARRRSP